MFLAIPFSGCLRLSRWRMAANFSRSAFNCFHDGFELADADDDDGNADDDDEGDDDSGDAAATAAVIGAGAAANKTPDKYDPEAGQIFFCKKQPRVRENPPRQTKAQQGTQNNTVTRMCVRADS